MALTRTPRGAASTASVRVRLSTPPLAAEYAAVPLWPSALRIEPQLMMLPEPWRYICRSAARAVRNTPFRLMSMVRSQSASV